MYKLMKCAKELGWDKIDLTKKGFNGAVQSYKSDNGSTVALCFNFHEAFIVEDDAGLFGVNDLYEGIVKSGSFDVEDVGDIEGATSLAWEGEEGFIEFDEERLKELGIDDFSVRESISNRIKHLSVLDKKIDMQA